MLRSRMADRGVFERLKVLLGAVAEKEHLEVKGPAVHVCIEIRKVGIVCHRLVSASPTKALADPFGKRCFACANIARHQHKVFRHDNSVAQV